MLKSLRETLPIGLQEAYFLAVLQQVVERICGGKEDYPDVFVKRHTAADYAVEEWRFQGYLAFGGKLRTDHDLRCKVNCYPEHESPERRAIIVEADAALEHLYATMIQSHLTQEVTTS